jgi:hypothetical protein
VPLLPDSPRSRRRLAWTGSLAVLAAGGAAVVLLIPSRSPPPPAPAGNEGPAQLASAQGTRVTAADRRAIDATLDRFLPAGMARRNPAAAWALAGPEMRSGSTLAEWENGTSPVPYFPVRETSFHDWQTIDAGPRYVIFNLLVHPKPHTKAFTSVFSGEVVKVGGRWLVNRLYTIAVMPPITRTTHEIGPADFAAPPASPPQATKAVLGPLGILPVVMLLSLSVLLPVTLGGVALVRARRFRKASGGGMRRELPPLPSRPP